MIYLNHYYNIKSNRNHQMPLLF